jgi:hypothetical protein
VIDGEDFHVCPKGLITRESHEWLSWHTHYKNHFLPVAGGLLDQTAIFLEAMNFIENTIARVLKEKRKTEESTGR